jgi:DNA-binding NtrC family response regulator
VEDEMVYAEYLRVNIERLFPALTISMERSAENALQLMSQDTYDLVISDSTLPGMGGINLFYRLKKEFPQTKTILLFNYYTQKDIDLLEKEGLFGYIEKPFLMDALAEHIQQALDI